jgi:peptidoglycan/xylan/chitin deacetylase (PgdA/CDA1 family)
MYHYFGDAPGADPEKLFVTQQRFAAQLDHLDRAGWRALTLDEYLAALDGAPTHPRSYLITIDDGHESVGRLAAPMLAERGVPSVLSVCPGLLGERARWSRAYPDERLSPAEELRALPGLGMELGVHSWDHKRMFGLDDAALDTHVRKSRAALEAATGVTAKAFAYPYGTHDPAARAAVAKAGYDVAFAVAREHGRFGVDRVFVQSTDSLLAFRLKLSGGYRLASRVGGRAWRVRHRVRAVAARARTVNTADQVRRGAPR